MASISSVASVFVILLVAYCSSVPLPTDDDYTTAFYDFATGKPMTERESMPMTFSGELNTFSTKLDPKREFGHKSDNSESREYTTAFPHARREFGDKKESDESHEYTTGLPLVERELLEKKDSSESHEYTTGLPLVERELLGKKESSESGEHTTGRTYMTGGHQKRTIIGETTFAPFEATSMISKRSDKGEHDHVEGDSDEITTERIIVTGERDVDESNTVAMEGESNDGEDKRSVGADMFDGLTTEYATTKDGHHKRTASVTVEPFYYEATSMFNERALAGESEEKTTERSFVPRTVDFEHFSTMESATDFNGRVEHKNERELVDPELTTFTPESSEHRERAVQQPSSMKLTKDAYRPVRVEKNFDKTGYSSFNEGSYDKSYPKKDYHH